MGYIPVFLWKPETQSSSEIFQVGFGLTIPSGTVHRLVGAEEVVELKKKALAFFVFYWGDQIASMEGGGGGSKPVFLLEPRVIVIFNVGSEKTFSLWIRVWDQTDTSYDICFFYILVIRIFYRRVPIASLEGVGKCVDTLQGFCLIDFS